MFRPSIFKVIRCKFLLVWSGFYGLRAQMVRDQNFKFSKFCFIDDTFDFEGLPIGKVGFKS